MSESWTLSGRLFQSLGAEYEKALPPLVDFTITTNSPEFSDLRDRVGLKHDRIVRYAGAVLGVTITSNES